MYIRIARVSREKKFEGAMSEISDLFIGAILPIVSQDDAILSHVVPQILRKNRIPFEICLAYADDAAQYLFEQGHKKASGDIRDGGWSWVWFPKDMCDILEKQNFI